MVAVATTPDAPYSLEQLQKIYVIRFFRFIWGEKVIRWRTTCAVTARRQRV